MSRRALARKAWCELRGRWWLGLAILAVVIAAGRGEVGLADSPLTVFVLVAIVLGTGALRQERALGTLGFSLALPVPRGHLIALRAAAAIAGVAALAGFVVAWAPLVAWLSGAPVAVPWRLGVIWAVCGAAIACLAQLVASVVASDGLGYLATLLIVLGYEATVELTGLHARPAWNLFLILHGGPSLPWPSLAGAGVIAAGLIAIAARLARRLAP